MASAEPQNIPERPAKAPKEKKEKKSKNAGLEVSIEREAKLFGLSRSRKSLGFPRICSCI